jgi:LmbE family N-acetylglucosaminyl deacetylase
MNILAIGAHPDDVEIYCGGTLTKFWKNGHKIYIALTTSGNIGSKTETRESIAAIREQEQLDAARTWEAEVHFMRYNDEEVVDTPEVRRAVTNAIRWADPQIILTHHPDDPSTDHAMTGRITAEVLISLRAPLIETEYPPLRTAPALFFWETQSGLGFIPETFVDITEEIEVKEKAVANHKSQLEWTILPLEEMVRIIAAFRGLQCGCRYAEGFVAHRLYGQMPAYKLLP